MASLEEYVYKNMKTHLIFDFDKTLFELILDWDDFFNPIKTSLHKIDPTPINYYEAGKIDWGTVQNLYIEKGDKSKTNDYRQQCCFREKTI